MMLFLRFDIPYQTFQIRPGMHKCGISLLPIVESGKYSRFPDEQCTADFDILNQTGQGYCRVKVSEYMHMVFRATDTYGHTLVFDYRARHIPVEPVPMFLVEYGFPVAGAENEVIKDLCIGAQESFICLDNIVCFARNPFGRPPVGQGCMTSLICPDQKDLPYALTISRRVSSSGV